MGKYKGQIDVKKFCEKERKKSDPIQEESLDLNFKVSDEVVEGYNNPCELLGMTHGEISDFIGLREDAGVSIGTFSGKKSGVYNLKLNGHEFTGNEFTSFEVKKVKKVGANVIVLRLRIPYEEQFHRLYPGFVQKVIDIEITEVNEQKIIPQPEDGEE